MKQYFSQAFPELAEEYLNLDASDHNWALSEHTVQYGLNSIQPAFVQDELSIIAFGDLSWADLECQH